MIYLWLKPQQQMWNSFSGSDDLALLRLDSDLPLDKKTVRLWAYYHIIVLNIIPDLDLAHLPSAAVHGRRRRLRPLEKRLQEKRGRRRHNCHRIQVLLFLAWVVIVLLKRQTWFFGAGKLKALNASLCALKGKTVQHNCSQIIHEKHISNVRKV